MKYVKLIMGIMIGLLSTTIIAEAIEFTIVKSASGKSFEYLQANQNEYFDIRNRNWILIAKAFYSLIAGIVGGYLTTLISKGMAKMAIYILLFVQIVSLTWGGFFSDLSGRGPILMWTYLLLVIPIGIWIGHKWKNRYALLHHG